MPPLTPSVEAPAAPPSLPPERPWTYLGPQAGSYWATAYLNPGYRAGVEVERRTGLLDDRLRVGLVADVEQASGQAGRIVIGRGWDPALIENALAVPLEFVVSVDLWKGDGQSLAVRLGGGAIYVSNDFIAFSAPVEETGWGELGLAGLTYSHALGGGDLVAYVGFELGNASPGKLSSVTTAGVTSAVVTVSYLFGL